MDHVTAAKLEECWHVLKSMHKAAKALDELANKLPLLPITRVAHVDHIQNHVHALHLAIGDVWRNVKYGTPLPNFFEAAQRRTNFFASSEKFMLIETADGGEIADTRIEWFWPREGLPMIAYVPDLKDSDCFGYVELKARTIEELEASK